MAPVSVIALVAVAMAELASATDYPATWALANHGSVAAANVYAITTASNDDAKFPGTMSSGDVNGDGVNDFTYELPAGTLNVHFGGISADLDLDSITFSGSNGFSIVTGSNVDIWGTIAGDVNNDGFNDVLFFHQASGSVKIIFGKASGWSASYTVASMTWDGTDGIELTYTGQTKFGSNSFGGYTPQILTNFDINNDGIDDIAVNSAGTNNGGQVNIFFGKSSLSSVDGSTFDGSNGFSLADAANTRLGRGLAVGDINGDGIDDIVASSRSDQPSAGAGCLYVLYGGGTYPALIADIYSHVDGSTGFRLCGGAANTYFADYFITAADFNGDSIADILFAGRGTQTGLYMLFGKTTFPASVTLPFASGEGVSFTGLSNPALVKPPNLGKFNDDQYDDIAVGEGTNVYVVFGSASPGDTLDLTALSGTDGFKLTDSDSLSMSFYSPIDMTGDGSTDLVPFTQGLTPSFTTITNPYVIVGNGPSTASGGSGGGSSTSSTSSSSTFTFTRTLSSSSTISSTRTLSSSSTISSTMSSSASTTTSSSTGSSTSTVETSLTQTSSSTVTFTSTLSSSSTISSTISSSASTTTSSSTSMTASSVTQTAASTLTISNSSNLSSTTENSVEETTTTSQQATAPGETANQTTVEMVNLTTSEEGNSTAEGAATTTAPEEESTIEFQGDSRAEDGGLEGWVILTIVVVVVIVIGVAVTLVICFAVMVYDKKQKENNANEQAQVGASDDDFRV